MDLDHITLFRVKLKIRGLRISRTQASFPRLKPDRVLSLVLPGIPVLQIPKVLQVVTLQVKFDWGSETSMNETSTRDIDKKEIKIYLVPRATGRPTFGKICDNSSRRVGV